MSYSENQRLPSIRTVYPSLSVMCFRCGHEFDRSIDRDRHQPMCQPQQAHGSSPRVLSSYIDSSRGPQYPMPSPGFTLDYSPYDTGSSRASSVSNALERCELTPTHDAANGKKPKRTTCKQAGTASKVTKRTAQKSAQDLIKIANEQESRRRQAASLTESEDIKQICYGFHPEKKQRASNGMASLLLYDKHDNMVGNNALLVCATAEALEQREQGNPAFFLRMQKAMRDALAPGAPSPLVNSVLSQPNGSDIDCVPVLGERTCATHGHPDAVQRRKRHRRANLERNVAQFRQNAARRSQNSRL